MVYVISLGGSLIIDNKINLKFLLDFRKALEGLKEKFVVVTGGGKTARLYIDALSKAGASKKVQCLNGIEVVRFHARFLMQLFSREANRKLPRNLKDVKNLLKRDKVVISGALRFKEDNTSDGTAALIASYLKADFINMTNVKGLYDKDPKKNKGARLIRKIKAKDFEKIAKRIHYKPGQHFVLDQNSARLIAKKKIKTYIIGDDLGNFKKLILGKRFIGTEIY